MAFLERWLFLLLQVYGIKFNTTLPIMIEPSLKLFLGFHKIMEKTYIQNFFWQLTKYITHTISPGNVYRRMCTFRLVCNKQEPLRFEGLLNYPRHSPPFSYIPSKYSTSTNNIMILCCAIYGNLWTIMNVLLPPNLAFCTKMAHNISDDNTERTLM